ncbi:MAG: heavy-metal-associated domain-containing protein [Terriglobia bacterium]
MKERYLTAGSALAAFGASVCCLGPLLLGGLGFGAVLVSTFAPLRPYFLALSSGLLALGFYFVYRKPRPAEACASDVCPPDDRARPRAKVILWLATLAVAALAFFPLYGARFVSIPAGAAPTATAQVETVELKISGMTCEACAGVVKQTLMETPGVAEAEVDYPSGRASVKYDPGQTGPAQLIEAVNAAGYQAEISGPDVGN